MVMRFFDFKLYPCYLFMVWMKRNCWINAHLHAGYLNRFLIFHKS
jgi:hypothetical protein